MLKKLSLISVVFLVTVFFKINAVFAAIPEPQISNIPNCPEGYFYKLTGPSLQSHNKECYNLLKPELGFDVSSFPNITNNIEVACDVNSIQQAINSAPNTGLIINIPECTLTVANTQIEIDKDNLVIQGAGIGKTIINATGRTDAFQSLFNIKESTNIIIRDMSIEGNNKEVIGINSDSSNNILVERIYFRNGRIAVRFPFTQKFTARYIDSFNNTFHGVAAKDCGDTNAVCSGRSSNFSVYSNSVGGGGNQTSNTGNGIDLHSQNGEVAGNYSYKNGQGNKFPDARNIWVHNNFFEDNNQSGWVIRTYSIIKDPVENQYYFSNTLKDNNSDFGFVLFDGPAKNINNSIYLINNNYQGTESNVPNKISTTNNIKYKVCENTQDFIRTPENIKEVVSGEVCDLPNKIKKLQGAAPSTTYTPTPEPTLEPSVSPTIIFDPKFDLDENEVVNILDLIEIIKYLFQ